VDAADLLLGPLVSADEVIRVEVRIAFLTPVTIFFGL
jgi:hypothetical protein